MKFLERTKKKNVKYEIVATLFSELIMLFFMQQ